MPLKLRQLLFVAAMTSVFAAVLVVVATALLTSNGAQVAAGADGLSTQDLSVVTPQDLAAALAGPGVTISNVTFTGANVSAGLFSGGTGIIGATTPGSGGLEGGVILSSGDVGNVVGPNIDEGTSGFNDTSGDTDLTTLSGHDTFDAAVLEFDFVPTADTVFFEYVFGSEEYNEFVNSQYNDVFAFFVNGANCATVPGPDQTPEPVAINVINNGNPYGTVPNSHPELYINNDLESGSPFNTELDGLTHVLTCEASVTSNESNHVKLAIADTSDSVLDSDVFIKAGSFSTNRSPSLQLPGDQTVQNGDEITFGISCTDPEETDVLTLEASGLPDQLTFTDNGDGTGTVSGTASAAPDTYAVEFSCSDGVNPPVKESLNIVVTPAPRPNEVINDTDMVSAGTGGIRSTDGPNYGDGAIELTGIPAGSTITKALLFWNGPEAFNCFISAETVGSSTRNADVLFDDNDVKGENIGVSSPNDANCNSESDSYKADVTEFIHTPDPNGTYLIDQFSKQGADANGASLIVFYQDLNPLNNVDVTLFEGNDSNYENPFDANGWHVDLQGVNYIGDGAAILTLHVSDGQYADNFCESSFCDYQEGPTVINGFDDPPLVDQGQNFDGSSVSASHEGSVTSYVGGLWDIKSYDVSSFLQAGTHTVTITSPYYHDALSLVVAAIAVPHVVTLTPSPTPLPTETPSPTPTPSATPTNPATEPPTATPTPTPSPTPTEPPVTDRPTASPSATPQETVNVTNSPTPTRLLTEPPTLPPSQTPTPTPTVEPDTFTPIVTPSPTLTPTPTPTASPSRSPSPTIGEPDTFTPIVTPSPTPTPTPTPTPSPTLTPSPTIGEPDTFTPIVTPSPTPTITPAPSPGVTETPVTTQPPTEPPAHTPTATAISSQATPSGIILQIPTATPVRSTSTATPTPKPSPTVTSAGSGSPSPTQLEASVGPSSTEAPPPLISTGGRNSGRPEFAQSVLTPSELSTSLDVAAVNVALAGFTLMLLVLSSELFNKTVEENHYTLTKWFKPVTSPFAGIFGAVSTGWRARTEGTWLGAVGPPLGVLALAALIYGGLEPGFGLNEKSIVMMLAVVITVGLITYWYNGGQLLVSHRLFSMDGAIRIFPMGVVIAAVCVLLTRLDGFQPGIIYGFIASAAIVGASEPSEEQQGKTIFYPALALIGLCLVAWFLISPFRDLATDNNSWWASLPEAIAVGITVGALEGTFFQMIPIRWLDGHKLWAWNKLAWVLVAGSTAFLFWAILLHDQSSAMSSVTHGAAAVAIIAMLICLGLSVAFYSFFRLRGPELEAEAAEAA